MTRLQFALDNKRYDLAAHLLVLACAKALRNGGSTHEQKAQKTPQLLLQRSR